MSSVTRGRETTERYNTLSLEIETKENELLELYGRLKTIDQVMRESLILQIAFRGIALDTLQEHHTSGVMKERIWAQFLLSLREKFRAEHLLQVTAFQQWMNEPSASLRKKSSLIKKTSVVSLIKYPQLDVTIRDRGGFIPLYHAVLGGFIGIASLLISHSSFSLPSAGNINHPQSLLKQNIRQNREAIQTLLHELQCSQP